MTKKLTEYITVTDTILAEACSKCYGDAQIEGFKSRVIVNGNHRCVIYYNRFSLIIAFAGTDEWEDVMDDIKISKFETDYGKIHSGFLLAWNDLSKFVSKTLHKFDLTNKEIFITGHSLGGAIALLCAVNILYKILVERVVTFGCPRVGNKAWMNAYKSLTFHKTIRYVNNQDVITRVPIFNYYHVGITKYFDRHGNIVPKRPWTWTFLFRPVLTWKFLVKRVKGEFDHKMKQYYMKVKQNNL